MMFKTDIHSFNVWVVDIDSSMLEMWNHFDGWKLKSKDKLTKDQMIKMLYDVASCKGFKVVSHTECEMLSASKKST